MSLNGCIHIANYRLRLDHSLLLAAYSLNPQMNSRPHSTPYMYIPYLIGLTRCVSLSLSLPPLHFETVLIRPVPIPSELKSFPRPLPVQYRTRANSSFKNLVCSSQSVSSMTGVLPVNCSLVKTECFLIHLVVMSYLFWPAGCSCIGNARTGWLQLVPSPVLPFFLMMSVVRTAHCQLHCS